MPGRLRAAAAGATAAIVWALQEPLDRKLLRCDSSDIALLGKAMTRGGRGWRPAGLAIHTLNGVRFGLAFHEVRRILPTDPRKLAVGTAIPSTSCSIHSATSSIVMTRPTASPASHGCSPIRARSRRRLGATRSSVSFSAGSPSSRARRHLLWPAAVRPLARAQTTLPRYPMRKSRERPAHPSPSGLSPHCSRSMSHPRRAHAPLQQQLRTHFAAAVDHPFRPGGELLDDLQPSAGRPTLVGGQRH